jgi:N6-L-threonylcarbamoyladenine synthase
MTIESQARELQPKILIVAGGVACNEELRAASNGASERLGIPVYFPSKQLSTDNAAMIAAAGFAKLARGETSKLYMTADVTLRLQNVDLESDAASARSKRYKM